MRALSIRQPFAELILRGIKTAELRSVSTNIIGERFYIYAAGKKGTVPIWSNDLRIATPPGWLIELAEQVRLIEPGASLPTGEIVGTAMIEKVIPPDLADGDAGRYRWQLSHVKRLGHPLKPTRRPQPVWFRPF